MVVIACNDCILSITSEGILENKDIIIILPLEGDLKVYAQTYSLHSSHAASKKRMGYNDY